MRQHSCMVAAVKQRKRNGAAPPHKSIWGARKEGGQSGGRGRGASRRTPPVPGPRRDPDCLLAQRGLKRLRSVLADKERGNECFSRRALQEAYDHYSASLDADPQLCTPFMAQVWLLRLAGVALWRHAQSANHKRAIIVHKCCMHPGSTPLLQAVCNRAAAAAKLGRHQDALADAEQAIQLDASYAKAYVRRAQVGLPRWLLYDLCLAAGASRQLGVLTTSWRMLSESGDCAEGPPWSNLFLPFAHTAPVLAQAHLELKNFDAAVLDYNKVAELDDSCPGVGRWGCGPVVGCCQYG